MHITLDLITFIHVWACTHRSAAQICNEPDLRLWSLNVIALLHSENEKNDGVWG